MSFLQPPPPGPRRRRLPALAVAVLLVFIVRVCLLLKPAPAVNGGVTGSAVSARVAGGGAERGESAGAADTASTSSSCEHRPVARRAAAHSGIQETFVTLWSGEQKLLLGMRSDGAPVNGSARRGFEQALGRLKVRACGCRRSSVLLHARWGGRP